MPAAMTMVQDLNDTGTKSCCTICRELIKSGADPERTIEFMRGDTRVFTTVQTIGWWAARRVREADHSGPMRFVMYRP